MITFQFAVCFLITFCSDNCSGPLAVFFCDNVKSIPWTLAEFRHK